MSLKVKGAGEEEEAATIDGEEVEGILSSGIPSSSIHGRILVFCDTELGAIVFHSQPVTSETKEPREVGVPTEDSS